jgi:hypothetical protein
VVVEKAVDSAMLLIVALAVSLAMPLPPWLKVSSLAVSGALTIILAVMMLLAGGRVRAPHRLDRWIGPGSWAARSGVSGAVGRMAAGLRPLTSPRANIAVWSWSVIIWALMVSTNLLTLRALDISVPLVASALLLLTLNLGIMLPSAPARIGVFHYVCVLTMQLFGVGAGTALSYGILLHAVVHIPLFVGGAAGLAAGNVSLGRLARATTGGKAGVEPAAPGTLGPAKESLTGAPESQE